MAKSQKSTKIKISSYEKKPQAEVEIQKSDRSQTRVVGKRQAIPTWVWALIVSVVAVGVYLGLKLINQPREAVSALPLEMTAAEAAKLDSTDWFFLDVREQNEWEEAHIERATLIPLGELSSRLDELPKDQKIVVVCRSGRRSAEGRDILLGAGFTEVTSMAGGMNDWISQSLPYVTGP